MSARIAIAAIAAALTLAACGGKDEPDPKDSSSRPDVAALRQAWSVKPGALWNAPPNDTSPWAWATETSLIVPGKKQLTAYAASDGAEQWKVALPRAVCAVVDAPNPDGIGAVLLSGGTKVNPEACGAVAAVDTRAGKLLWTKSLRGRSSYGMTGVQIGPEAVAITNPCDRAITLSARTGAALADFGERGSGNRCTHSFASDGRVVVDGRTHVDREEFAGYDAVSGKRLWSVPVRAAVSDRGALPTAERVISSSPLVIDASVNSHRFLYRVDPQARTLTPFGREADDQSVPVFTRAADSRVLVQYGGSRVLFAYDAESGDEVSRTVLAPQESAAGVSDGAVITASAGGSAGLAVRATDPESGDRQVLGTGKLDGVAAAFGRGAGFDVAVAGSTLVVRTTDGLVAYRLPSEGRAVEASAPPRGLADDEIAPDKVVDLCTGITPATKRALGFANPTLAAPANCGWVESLPRNQIRQLHVSAAGHEPRGKSATAQAERNFAQLRRADSVNDLPALTPLAGLGDEAAIGEHPSDSFRFVRVVTRVANVVILVEVSADKSASEPGEVRVLRRGARLAAADLVAELERRR